MVTSPQDTRAYPPFESKTELMEFIQRKAHNAHAINDAAVRLGNSNPNTWTDADARPQ